MQASLRAQQLHGGQTPPKQSQADSPRSSLGCPHAGERSHAAVYSLAIHLRASEKLHACSWEFVTVTGICQAAFIAASSFNPAVGGMLWCLPAEKGSQAGICPCSSSLDTGSKTLFSSPAT